MMSWDGLDQPRSREELSLDGPSPMRVLIALDDKEAGARLLASWPQLVMTFENHLPG
jgi:hypothetical protein